MSDIKLKPCPFCGGEAILFVSRDYGVKAVCKKCFCCTIWTQDTDEEIKHGDPSAISRVVTDWNRRVNNG